MKTSHLPRNQVLIAIALTLVSTAVSADTLTGRVVEITDGDTLTLLVGRQSYKIQIAAIDAPERYQTWGDQSRTNLSRLTLNRTAVANCSRLERWDHQACQVTVNDMDIGLQQIKEGMAWWIRQDAHVQSAEDQSAYENAELMAKMRRLGLWGATNPVPPWEFRGRH
jgi:endonuclease YncB( thermonuclease family)